MRKSPAVGAEARRKVRREWELGPGKWGNGDLGQDSRCFPAPPPMSLMMMLMTMLVSQLNARINSLKPRRGA